MKEGRAKRVSINRINGPSPAEDRYYALILFDISDKKKYRAVVKAIKTYGRRIQKSVFEGWLRQSDFRKLIERLEKLMNSEKFEDSNDSIRIYRMAGNDEMVVYGDYASSIPEENIFF